MCHLVMAKAEKKCNEKSDLTFPRQRVGIGRYGEGEGNDNMVTLSQDGGKQLKQFAVKLFRC